MNKYKSKEGITLIALVITIIVLLILAGVTVATLTGENGLIKKSELAQEVTDKANIKEELQIILLDIKTRISTEERRDTVVTDCNELNGKENVEKIEYSEEQDGSKYSFVTYKKYRFKIDKELNIIDMENIENNTNNKSARYLLIEVKGYLNSNAALINELAVYDENKQKIQYNVLNDLEYDSVTKGKSYYWNDSQYWGYTNLNNGNTNYISNKNGGQNCTIFLYNNSSNPNTNQYARFIIDLGDETEIGQIRFCIGGVDGRTPVKVTVYKINNFVDGTEEGSTYLSNVVQENDEGLSKISEKEFSEVILTPTWFDFLEEQDETEYQTARYLLIGVKDSYSSKLAVINELEVYDKYKEKIQYNVLTDLEYDSVTKGKSYYWTNSKYWNYTNLNDGNISYTSNTVGNQNCTAFIYYNANIYTDQYARFVIDLENEVEIGQIRFCIGGVEGRTPVKISAYKINNFVDGAEQGSSYLTNVVQENDDGLLKLAEKEFSEVILSPTWFDF